MRRPAASRTSAATFRGSRILQGARESRFSSQIGHNWSNSTDLKDSKRLARASGVAVHVTALRALILGFVVGLMLTVLHAIASHLGWISDKSLPTCEVPSEFAASLKEGNICTETKVMERVQFVGKELHVVNQGSIGNCCNLCTSHRECVGVSFNEISSRCMLFKDPILYAMASSWTRSLWLRSSSDEPSVLLTFEAVRFGIQEAFRHSMRKPLFRVETHYQDPKSGARKTRSDFREHVVRVLRELGLRMTNHRIPDEDVAVYWGLHSDMYVRKSFTSKVLLNMIPGITQRTIGAKDAMHRTISEWSQRIEKRHLESFLLESYLLPDDFEALLKNDPNSVWIFKPLKSWSGDGIFISSIAQIHEKQHLMGSRELVAQKYIIDPLKIEGYKFDTRWWVLITSLEPLRVYAVSNAYIRLAAKLYKKDEEHHGDRCIHLTNGKVLRSCQMSNIERKVPFHFNDDKLRKSLSKKISEEDLERMKERTRSALLHTTLLALPELRLSKKATNATTFQLLSFDIIYDERTLSPWVEEVNADGFLGKGIQRTGSAMGVDILKDMFLLLGAAGYDRSSYQADFERIMHKILRSNWNARSHLRDLQATIDELRAPQRSWQLLFPRIDGAESADDFPESTFVHEDDEFKEIIKNLNF